MFTIPEELRIYVLKDKVLLDCRFHFIYDIFLCMFYKINKTGNITPWRPIKYFDYTFLRNAYLTQMTTKAYRLEYNGIDMRKA